MIPKFAAAVGLSALVLGGALLVAQPGEVRFVGLLPDDVIEPTRRAPPYVEILDPQDGDASGRVLRVTGHARALAGIATVQARIDGGTWRDVPVPLVGAQAASFTAEFLATDGEHVVEARAFDGDAWSLAARARVRVGPDPGPPVLRVLAPRDGAGLDPGPVEVRGLVESAAPARVVVHAGPRQVEATIRQAGGLAEWNATIELPPGLHRIDARATAAGVPGVSRALLVMVGTPRPPSVTLETPAPRASYGSTGAEACGGDCILFSGLAFPGDAPVHHVLLSLDGAAERRATVVVDATAAAWTWRVPVDTMFSGPHTARAVAVGLDGTRSAPVEVAFLVRTARVGEILGDETPRPTGTPLAFQLVGDDAARAQWYLDHAPLGAGESITVRLLRPGPHTLAVDAAGSTRALALFALNRPPSVSLGPASGPARADVFFHAEASDPDGEVVAFLWDFGDGFTTETSDPRVVHRYGRSGTYAATVTALDGDGGATTATASASIGVALPVASFAIEPGSPSTLDEVVFTDRSVATDGPLVAWRWTFPGGVHVDCTASGCPGRSDRSVAFRFPARGPQAVSLAVTDDRGLTGTRVEVVDVANLRPLVDFRWDPREPETGQPVAFLANVSKPDGKIASYRWEFPGENATGGAAVHAFTAPGRHRVALHVVDDWGERAMQALDVVVSDARPVVRAVRIDPPEPLAQQAVHLEAVVQDKENGTLTFRWDLGDGTTTDRQSPSHRYARSGVYDGTVVATDGAGGESLRAFRVVVRNAPPLAALGEPEGDRATFPVTLHADARDPDGRITRYRFDADGDGRPDCDGVEPFCVFVYPVPGTYRATLLVTDDEGATAEGSRLVDVKLPPSGTAPPHVTIESPVAGAALRGTILVHGEAKGVRPIVAVELQLRNDTWAFSPGRSAWAPVEGLATWRLFLDTRAFPDGAFELVVRARDESGATGDARIPLALQNGPRPSSVAVSVAEPFQPGVEVAKDTLVRGSAYHPDGGVRVRWRVDEGPWRDAQGPALAWAIPLQAAALTPGEHVLHVDAFRGVAERASTTVPFRVPDARPILVLDEPPGPVAYGLLHAKGRMHGAGTVEWRLDDGLWTAFAVEPEWRLDHLTTSIRGGKHEVSFRAVSHDGQATDPQTFVVHVLNARVKPPTPVEEAPPAQEIPGLPVVGLLAALALAARRRRE